MSRLSNNASTTRNSFKGQTAKVKMTFQRTSSLPFDGRYPRGFGLSLPDDDSDSDGDDDYEYAKERVVTEKTIKRIPCCVFKNVVC